MYYFYCFVRMMGIIIITQMLLGIGMILCNSFPLFLMLWVATHSYSLPNEVRLIKLSTPDNYGMWKIVPKGTGAMQVFARLKQEIGLVISEVSPGAVISCFFSGENVLPSIKRMFTVLAKIGSHSSQHSKKQSGIFSNFKELFWLVFGN